MALKQTEPQGESIMETNVEFLYDKERCLTLWYYDDAERSFFLTFKLYMNGIDRYLKKFQSQIETRKRWTKLKVDLVTLPDPDNKSSKFSL